MCPLLQFSLFLTTAYSLPSLQAGIKLKMIGPGLNRIVLLLLVLSISACTSTYCRQSYRNKNGKIRNTTTTPLPVGPGQTVLVYKYDGSLQCGLGQAISPKEMAKQLGDIKILDQKKMNDGLMHITVCGSITGDANVFTIDANDLSKAKQKKFKVWEY